MRLRNLWILLIVCGCFAISTEAQAEFIFLRDLVGIKRANLDGTGLTTILSGGGEAGTNVFSNQIIADIEVDATNALIYWQQGDGIYRANFDGTGKTSVRSDGVHTNGLGVALDVAGGTVYWGRQNGNFLQLYSANLDGTGAATLVENIDTGTPLNHAWDVDVDPAGGKLYFLKGRDGGDDGIWMANVTGAGAPVKIIDTAAWGRGSTALDPANGVLYSQTLNGQAQIWQADLGGGNDTLVANTSAHVYIDLLNNTLYGTTTGGALNLYDLNTTPADYDTGSPLITGLSGSAGIAIFSNPIPEPGALVLAALGLAGLGMLTWRRRKGVRG